MVSPGYNPSHTSLCMLVFNWFGIEWCDVILSSLCIARWWSECCRSTIPAFHQVSCVYRYADENDEDIIEITPVKRKRLDSHSVPEFFNNIFKKFSDWFKRTSQNNPRLFGVSTESNSAAAAIAHGGQVGLLGGQVGLLHTLTLQLYLLNAVIYCIGRPFEMIQW